MTMTITVDFGDAVDDDADMADDDDHHHAAAGFLFGGGAWTTIGAVSISRGLRSVLGTKDQENRERQRLNGAVAMADIRRALSRPAGPAPRP